MKIIRDCIYIFTVFVLSGSLYGQTLFTEILNMSYSDIPLKLRVENSGIYLVSSFQVDGDEIWLQAFDYPQKMLIRDNKVQKVITGEVLNSSPYLPKRNNSFWDSGNKLKTQINEIITIYVTKDQLTLKYAPGYSGKEYRVNFPSNLAYADLIGVDRNGITFLIVETFLNLIPLEVERSVYRISPDGEVLNILVLPSHKYLYTTNDLQIDSAGNLYFLLSEQGGMKIYRVSGLSDSDAGRITFPEFKGELHFNDIVPTAEAAVQNNRIQNPSEVNRVVSRLGALKTGDTYVVYEYSCRAENLAPSDKQAPDGDMVKTPSWLINGLNAKVPYKWGGFSTLADFAAGLKNGRFAGDINTSGVSSYAVGVDCSGFVSRCWNLGYHCTTRDMPNITYLYDSWDKLRPGDAILKTGHVRMFVERTPNGAFRTVEASARDWGVSYWTYTPSDLTSYSPRVLDGMLGEYSLNQPVLKSVKVLADNTAEITWSCDTTGVKGYRLYKSTDGISWNMVKDTNALKTTSARVNMVSPAEYYRVASVNDSSSAESNWSNAMGAGNYSNSKKALIVDGFERETGGWRGHGNILMLKYGKAFQELNFSFDMVSSDSIIHNDQYDMIFWMLGDESTTDETFSADEQKLLSGYLQKGGRVFISGSEIGWDLYYRGTAEDRAFYNNFLKAGYVADDANSVTAAGTQGNIFSGISLTFGQAYEIGYPDEIYALGGSTICMKYGNNKIAGVQYSGKFGNSEIPGKMIYLAFPLETTANDTSFNKLIGKAVEFFTSEITSSDNSVNQPVSFSLSQNYPNPFNPETRINYSVAEDGNVSIKLFSILGEEITVMVNEFHRAGNYTISFSGSHISSGIYYYTLNSGSYSATRKMILLK